MPSRPTLSFRGKSIRSDHESKYFGPSQATKNFRFMGELRAHSPSNEENDDYTSLWSCIFEPVYKGSHPNLAATCGGNTICFVDCATMTILKKYKHLEEETFITMAWTALSTATSQVGENSDKIFSILAAAGAQGDIKLLMPSMLLCYSYLQGHRSEVYSLCFSETQPRRLISAGRDNCIFLWELGIPIPEGETIRSVNQCLYRFDGLNASVISLAFTPDNRGFLAGCDDSDCQYFEIPCSQSPKMNGKLECLQSFYGYEDNYHGSNIDCLHILDEDLVISKGACDAEFIVWDLKKSLSTGIPHALSFIKWEKSDCSFLRSSLRKINQIYYLLVGCPNGSIFIYFLPKDLGEYSRNIFEPDIKFVCDNSKTKIRHVDISNSGDYIIAVNENNGIFVWRLIE